jgi:hypothetical protein
MAETHNEYQFRRAMRIARRVGPRLAEVRMECARGHPVAVGRLWDRSVVASQPVVALRDHRNKPVRGWWQVSEIDNLHPY